MKQILFACLIVIAFARVAFAIDISQPFINAQDYGAVCDHKTDDTSAIQSCIDTGAIYDVPCFIPGQCKVTALNLPGNGGLLGAGTSNASYVGSTLIGTSGYNLITLMPGPPYGATDTYHIEHIQLYGGDNGLEMPNGRAITSLHMNDVQISQFNYAGIEVDTALERFSMNDINIGQGQWGIRLGPLGSYIGRGLITNLITLGQAQNCIDLEGNHTAGSSLNIDEWYCGTVGQSGLLMNAPANFMHLVRFNTEAVGRTPGTWSAIDFSHSPNPGRGLTCESCQFAGSEGSAVVTYAINRPPVQTVLINPACFVNMNDPAGNAQYVGGHGANCP